MRTQLSVGLLSMALAGGLLGAAGCDDVTAGQPGEPSGPLRLVRVVIQDARVVGSGTLVPNRAAVTDLLDNATPVACSDVDPVNACVPQFTVNFVSPSTDCVNGFCVDPLKPPASGVPLAIPRAFVNGFYGLPGGVDVRDAGGGVQVRVVFDKVPDSAIETVTMDPTRPPGMTNTYMLAAGVIELDDPTGTEVPAQKTLDVGGSHDFSADLDFSPFGPALVIKPKAPLAPATKYTIKMNSTMIKDHQGNNPADQNGTALPATYTISFTTEGITQTFEGQDDGVFGLDFPTFTSAPDPPAEIAPNEVVLVSFWTPVAGDNGAGAGQATLTVTGPAGVQAISYSDRGGDPTACAPAPDPGSFVLVVANSDGAGHTADWPAGDYTLTFTVGSALNPAAPPFTSDPVSFTVTGAATDPTMDGNARDAHLAPAECTP